MTIVCIIMGDDMRDEGLTHPHVNPMVPTLLEALPYTFLMSTQWLKPLLEALPYTFLISTQWPE